MAVVVGEFIFALGLVAMAFALVPSLWNFALVLASKCSRVARRFELAEDESRSASRPLKFAVIVPAHNEESAIQACVQSILAQNYPDFECLVVADNCSDRTAELAAECGATVLERHSETPSSKGQALEYGVGRIYEIGGFDCVCIFDSDSVVSDDFLLQAARQLDAGFDAVSGRYLASNANDSLVSALSTLYWAMTADLYNSSHAKLRLNSLAQGVGFAFKVSALPDGWHMLSITEDCEAAISLGIDGKRIGYAPLAMCYTEQPTDVRTLFSQLRRWRTGTNKLFGAYWRHLFANMIRKPSIRSVDLFALLFEYICPDQLAFGIVLLLTSLAFGVHRVICLCTILLTLAFALIIGAGAVIGNGQVCKRRLLATLCYPVHLLFMGAVGITTWFCPSKHWNVVAHAQSERPR